MKEDIINYLIGQDIESVIEILGITMGELADELNVTRLSISNWISGKKAISDKHIDAFYSFAYKKGIYLNRIKEQFYREDKIEKEEVLLFHGAKKEIKGNIDLKHNKRINDFGNGFYCGENLEQSAMFVATYPDSSLYMLKFNPNGLKGKKFKVDREWMFTIAYFRGLLNEYGNSEYIVNLIHELENVDYIVAPIADNKMFEIIDSFIEGEITDVQCQHCLSATNLGMQYVFISTKSLKNIELLERCYLSKLEKEAYLVSRQENYKINTDKVKLARKQYRNQGNYIEEILNGKN